MEFSANQLSHTLQALPAAPRYWVAYSGGADSHVLLHALTAVRAEQPACVVSAIHVHHGLQPDADAWAAQCEAACQALDVPCRVLRVNAQGQAGDSPEAAARAARYAALAAAVGEGEVVLTAHHMDDQAETLLLQLLRGAGVPGLAAMPRQARLGAGWLARPLLDVPRSALLAYAGVHGLDWIEDPSNRDPGIDRNYLRHSVMPLLRARWPAGVHNLARAARHQAEAADLLDALAALDTAESDVTPGPAGGQISGLSPEPPGEIETGFSAIATLPVVPLHVLSPARQRNALRGWLRRSGVMAPSSAVLARIQHEVLSARPDAMPCVAWPGGQVRRYRTLLYLLPVSTRRLPVAAGQHVAPPTARAPLALTGVTRALRRLHEGLQVCAVQGRGLSQTRLAGHRVELGYRQGGEVCRPLGRGHRHSLKKLFQEWGVPPWRRSQIPLIYVDGALAQVVGYCLCEPFAAGVNEPGYEFTATRPGAGHAPLSGDRHGQ